MHSLLVLAALVYLQAPVVAGNGTITGRILSVEGTPASGVRVTAMTPREPGQGEGVSMYASITQTDSSGSYRLENVSPGRYYITAGLLDAPTYYPGVAALSGATVVVVDGAVKDGIDFQLKIPPGMKVSGRLAILPAPRSTPATVMLAGTTMGLREAPVNPDGTFEFLRVPPGRYTLTNMFGLPPLPVLVSDHDLTDLEVGNNATGVRVSGRLVSPDPSPGTFSSTTVIITGPGASYQGRADATGVFEFLRVPPGNYSLRALPGAPTRPLTLDVGEKEITNLEIPIPFRRQVSGRIVLEDGRAWQLSPGILVEFRSGTGSTATSTQNGSFTIPLAEGEYQVGVRGLTLGHVLKSITVGDMPLTGTLRIAPGSSDPANIAITLASVPLESVQGVKVSGRIPGLPLAIVAGTRVLLTGIAPGTSTIETTANADGTFEFPKVPQGTYTARLDRVPNGTVNPRATRIVVGTENITGLQIPVDVRTAVSGRVTAVDANGAIVAGFSGSIWISFRRSGSITGTSVRPDGTFTTQLIDGEYTVSFDRIPAGHTVKSVVSGSTDLLKNLLKVENASPPAAIEVRLEIRP